jgi:hypothetical protein
MKASLTTLIVIVTIGSLGLVADSASACGGFRSSYSYSPSYSGGYSSSYSGGYGNGYNGAGYAGEKAFDPSAASQQTADPADAQKFVPGAAPLEQPAAEAAQPAAPAANIRVATPEESFPSVAMGSILILDGQELGSQPGMVRMRIHGLALPTKVLDWNDSSAKIQLPQLDLSKSTQAEIEVMRADGSLASSSQINLTPAATRLALGN